MSLGRRSVASGRPSYYSNSRRLCTENLQYIFPTAAYLTTVRQVIIEVFYYTWNVLPLQPLKCLFLQFIAAQVGMFTKQRATAGLPGLCEDFRPTASKSSHWAPSPIALSGQEKWAVADAGKAHSGMEYLTQWPWLRPWPRPWVVYGGP